MVTWHRETEGNGGGGGEVASEYRADDSLFSLPLLVDVKVSEVVTLGDLKLLPRLVAVFLPPFGPIEYGRDGEHGDNDLRGGGEEGTKKRVEEGRGGGGGGEREMRGKESGRRGKEGQERREGRDEGGWERKTVWGRRNNTQDQDNTTSKHAHKLLPHIAHSKTLWAYGHVSL